MKGPKRRELLVNRYELEAARDACSGVDFYLDTASELAFKNLIATKKIEFPDASELDILIHVLAVGIEIAETRRAEDEAGASI